MLLTEKLKQKFKNSIKHNEEIMLSEGIIVSFKGDFIGFYQGQGVGSPNYLTLAETNHPEFEKTLMKWLKMNIKN